MSKTGKSFDFSGYATKNNLKCLDGRVIQKDAFKHHDGQTVPLVWQHLHTEPFNILGHAMLENRIDGIYAYGKFNDTLAGKNAKELVLHGDITALSIYANALKQVGSNVIHGQIKEVSLVLSGANPGAIIDNLAFQHADGSSSEDETEAIIYTGLDFELLKEENSVSKREIKHQEDKKEKTIQEIYDELTDEQKTVVAIMISEAIDSDDAEHSDMNQGGNVLKTNVFDNNTKASAVLSHSQISEIISDAQKCGSLKESILMHAQTYGITNIEVLFPEAQTISDEPATIKRDDEWVPAVINAAHHSPFSRIKSLAMDITADEARARGYVTATAKKEEIISALRRITTPTTIYKKQKLDRDDIIDITDFSIVTWLKKEMRGLLNEELARCVLIGDGRDAENPDKVNELNIRPIYTDEELYSHKVSVPSAATADDIIDEIIRARKFYKGSGNPAFYISTDVLTSMLLIKDGMGRRMYNNQAELASALRVAKIVEVPLMDGVHRMVSTVRRNLIGIMVNLKDYTIGADKGGRLEMFDDFDIDFNQYKYLLETRCSGALTIPKAAVVIEQIAV